MKRYFRYLKEDRLLSRLFVLSLLLILLTVAYILFNYRNLPPLLPIFNQLPWGERRLSPTPGIFLPSAVVFTIFIVNLFLSSLSYSRSPLIARMYAVTSFLISLLTLLFIFRTIELIA